jgi:hypothetical protein
MFVKQKICNEIYNYFLSQILKKKKRLQIVVKKMFKRLRALINVIYFYVKLNIFNHF